MSRSSFWTQRDRVVLVPYGNNFEDLGPFLTSLAPKTRKIWPAVSGFLALILIVVAVMDWQAVRSPFRIEGTVYLGETPTSTVVSIPVCGPERVTDQLGYFRHECDAGDAVDTIEVQLGGEPIHFRLEHPVTRSSFIELQLVNRTSSIRPSR